MGNITGTYDGNTGVLTLTASDAATLAQWETALRAVTYSNASPDPETATRTISFSVDDGRTDGNTTTKEMAIVATNTAPVNSVPGSQTVDQNETLVFDAANDNVLSVFDADAGNAAIKVTLAATNGVLTLRGTAGLDFTAGDGTDDVSMTFNGTIAAINEALDGLQFIPTSGYNGQATLQITTDDLGNTGAGEAETDTDQVDITIHPIEPVVVAVGAESTDGIFGVDDEITLTVTFDQPVTVDNAAGSLGLLLETGDTDREAMYVSGSGSHTLSFSYTVQAGDYNTDLDYVGTDALALHGATIRNSRGDDAVLTLPTVGGLNSISGQHDLVIDGVAPVAPQGLDVLFGNQRNVLDWSESTEADIEAYRVYGGTTAHPTTLLYTVPAPVTTYVHSDLTNGTAYYYRITAVDGAGNESPYSNEVSATSKAPQIITFDPLPVKTYGDGDFNAGATSSNSSIAITYRSSDERVATVVDGNIRIVGAGETILTASQAGDAGHTAAADVQQTLQVAAKSLTVTANNDTKNYDGTAYSGGNGVVYDGFVPGEDESVLGGSLVYSGSSQGAMDAGTYELLPGGLTSPNYDITFVPGVLTVSGGVENLLSFNVQQDGATVTRVYGAGDADGSAVASSGLPVGYASSNEDVATVDANGQVTIHGVGVTEITASQGGNLHYAPAADISFTLEVQPKELTVTARNATKVYDGTAYSGGNGVLYTGFVYGEDESVLGGSLVYSGSSQGAMDAGTYELLPGGLISPNYGITFVPGVLDILPATRTLTFSALPEKTYGDSDFEGGATSSSGEAITYSSSNPAVATVVDGRIRIGGAGTAVIVATVPENGNYANRPEAKQVLRVNKARQSITLDAPAEVGRGAGTVPLTVSVSSGLPTALSIDDPEVATLDGSTLNILRLGTVRITATQAGDSNHEPAEPVTVTVRVTDPTADLPVRVTKALSPNGDGINEYLIIEAIKDYPENRVTIFNRNGTVVWEASGYNNGTVAFRGIGAGRNNVPAGTYFYVAEIRVNGEWKYEKGWFVLRY